MEAAAASSDERLGTDELEIRPDEFMALARGRPLLLTARELELLTALARRPGRVVSREELYGIVWDRPFRKADRSVDVYIARLRRKLAVALPGEAFIHTHFGFGYRFAAEPHDGLDRAPLRSHQSAVAPDRGRP